MSATITVNGEVIAEAVDWAERNKLMKMVDLNSQSAIPCIRNWKFQNSVFAPNQEDHPSQMKNKVPQAVT